MATHDQFNKLVHGIDQMDYNECWSNTNKSMGVSEQLPADELSELILLFDNLIIHDSIDELIHEFARLSLDGVEQMETI